MPNYLDDSISDEQVHRDALEILGIDLTDWEPKYDLHGEYRCMAHLQEDLFYHIDASLVAPLRAMLTEAQKANYHYNLRLLSGEEGSLFFERWLIFTASNLTHVRALMQTLKGK